MNQTPKKFNNTSLPITTIIQKLKNKDLIVNESFQRKIVWHDSRMKQELIKSLIIGMPIGTIIFWETLDNEGIPISQIVDGQQRIKTIEAFINDEFCLNEETILKILQNKIILLMLRNYSNKDDKAKIILEKKGKTKYSNLPDYFKKIIQEHMLNIISIDNISEKEIREYFKVLQNQEKLKAGEILHSIEDNHILKFLNESDIKDFCQIINFNDNRMGFYKHFTVFMCMIQNDKIRMGMTDSEIIKLANKISINDFTDNEKFLEIITKIKNDIIHPDNHSDILQQGEGYLSVLGFKLLLWTYLYSQKIIANLSLSKKSQILKKISKMAGYLNSKDVDHKIILLKNNFNKYESYDSEKLYKGVRNAWKLGKTTHSKKEILDKFESINYLIEFISKNDQFDYLV